jgi:hypothetical protein
MTVDAKSRRIALRTGSERALRQILACKRDGSHARGIAVGAHVTGHAATSARSFGECKALDCLILQLDHAARVLIDAERSLANRQQDPVRREPHALRQ